MRIAIVGLGGVGGYLAASFAKVGLDVVGFARGKHLQEIQKNGIVIVEDRDEWRVPLKAAALEDAKGYFDVVMFCVKSYDLQDTLKLMRSHIDKNSILISFANGVNNAEVLQNIDEARILDACVYILADIQSAGVIRKKGEVFAAVFGGEESATQSVAKLFDEAELRYKTPQNIKEAIWKKYIFIAAFATLTSYYDESIGSIYEHHYDEAKELLEEIATFAKKHEGVDIFDEVQKALQTAQKVPYDSSTSMHKDFQNHARVELDNLSGFVKTPLMQKLYKELKQRL
ncbi:ketopantoate reductase family protein [Sulfurimonas sp.]